MPLEAPEASARVLLTGAGGFVGSHVLRHILANTDWSVVCPVTFRHRGLSDRIALAMADMPDAAHRVKVMRVDLAAPISMVTSLDMGHIDYVLNVASESHVDRSISRPGEFILNNVALLVNVLDWMRQREKLGWPVKAMVQVSTDEVYGPAPEGYAHREWVDGHLPSNPYSASKAAQEDIAFAYWRTYDLPIIITNTMNIIGETQDPEKFFPMVLARALAGQSIPIHSNADGSQIGSRFYLHARNQADGLLHVLNFALSNAEPSGSESLRHSDGGETPYRFHIVGEREVDNLSMAKMITEAAGVEGRFTLVDFHGSRPGHDLRYALDGAKMAAIGWKPPVPLEESIKTTVAWTLDRPNWLATPPTDGDTE